jgi:hypothetical protein
MTSLVRSEREVHPLFLHRFLQESHSSSPSTHTHEHILGHIDKSLEKKESLLRKRAFPGVALPGLPL